MRPWRHRNLLIVLGRRNLSSVAVVGEGGLYARRKGLANAAWLEESEVTRFRE